MAMKASTEAISGMRSDINKAIQEITNISSEIARAGRVSGDWSDAQSQQYSTLMQQASKATLQPLGVLQAAIPKLNKLEQALSQYGSVKFN